MEHQESSVSETVVTQEEKKPKESFWKGAGEFTRFVVLVLAIVIGVRMFIAQPFVVSGSSMVPTFQNANYLIVDELSYRFQDPKRGDVIIFHPPIELGTFYIKRIIGLPGETVAIDAGRVTITNKEYPDGFVLNEPYIVYDSPNDNYKVTIPENMYFVMGDNRRESFDSRRWGLLPKKNISGRALLRLFPVSGFGTFPGEHNDYQN